ncbi:MAG: EscU/YscU/HrcU family type III secretion system export apparatus switch protein [Candidatus Magnetoovum sp. WYHC-5]|nr:EscU/YscU/HrcU family type III secretion system export apparatus switch protein [Candidatus Magnetoovum sp. WYHC-5]
MKDNPNLLKKAAALKYIHTEDRAPKVIAKGRGAVAEKIVNIAKKSGIPLKEDRDLVEILSALDLYQEIPPELYRAVVEVLKFVYTISKKNMPIVKT